MLCVPVVTPENDCLAILELTKDVTQPPFDEDDVKITVLVSAWIGAAIHQNQQRVMLQKQQELNDYLLDLVKCYFSNAVGIQKLINEIAVIMGTTGFVLVISCKCR